MLHVAPLSDGPAGRLIVRPPATLTASCVTVTDGVFDYLQAADAHDTSAANEQDLPPLREAIVTGGAQVAIADYRPDRLLYRSIRCP
jgi:hypothetical protein